jgi:hypothetical protein
VAEYPSLSAALAESAGDEFVIVAGSLYLIGEAMELLGLLPGTNENERALNEWSAAKADSSSLSDKR